MQGNLQKEIKGIKTFEDKWREKFNEED